MNTRKAKLKQLRNNFRVKVIQRDNHRCKVCQINESNVQQLDAHHITDRHEMPNDGYVLENGISLCPSCHLKAEVYHGSQGKRWEENFHPNDLYKLINSSYGVALEKSKSISWGKNS